jgi:hypothetical protein
MHIRCHVGPEVTLAPYKGRQGYTSNVRLIYSPEMSRRLRLSRRGYDRLSPEAVDGPSQLGQLSAAQTTDRNRRIDMQ